MVEPRRAALYPRIPYRLRVVGLLYLARARRHCGDVLLLVEARLAGVDAGRFHPARDAAGGAGRGREARGDASAGAPEAQARWAEPAKPLPSIEQSDAMMRDTVSGLVGRKAFEAMVYPSQLVRRIVATVDNLPRETAPRRVMPLAAVPGAFGASGEGDEMVLSAANAQRYSGYVHVFEALDARALAQRYAEAYPLFQRAYADLGFPKARFHDRLLAAIDDMLEAPVPTGPVKLVRPKVLYQFADQLD